MKMMNIKEFITLLLLALVQHILSEKLLTELIGRHSIGLNAL